MPDTIFTPRTARRLLRDVSPKVELICRLYRDLEELCPQRIDSDQPVEIGYFSIVANLNGVIEELMSRGIEVKDLKHGMIDFPARRNGRKVLLCWQLGESSLEYWHELGAGYDARKKVEADGVWEGEEGDPQTKPAC